LALTYASLLVIAMEKLLVTNKSDKRDRMHFHKAIKPEPVPGVVGLEPYGVFVVDAHGKATKVGFRYPPGRPWRKSKEPEPVEKQEHVDDSV
jgi:hypothetical protein